MIITDNSKDLFYSSIALRYSQIFPFRKEQLEFTDLIMHGLSGKSILDVGCGTGELSRRMGEAGATVTAFDLNKEMLAVAQSDNAHPQVAYMWANMLHVVRYFGRAKFDGVVCYGNTLVHLLNPMQMRDFFSGVLTVLKPGGRFMLQILNYDYIVDRKLENLPVIDLDTLRFERFYKYEATREITFKTRLTLKESGEVIENSSELLGIGSEELTLLMDVAGMQNIHLYGGFNREPFGGEHLPLVITAEKGI